MTEAASRPYGWTLLELLVVLALVGVISGWSLPLAQGMMQRAQRSQARLTLLQISHWLERYASAQGRYPDALPASAWNATGLHYQITYTAQAQGFVLLAVPLPSQAGDPCNIFSLDHQGVRGVRQARWTAELCWSR